jgi:predicted metalloprotease with PDZ domain
VQRYHRLTVKNSSAHFLRLVGTAAIAAATLPALAQNNATEYRFTFPDVVHHVVQVEATFHNVPQQPLTVQMSRSSPGRYASFEYASNVFEEKFTDDSGKPLAVTKPDPRSWTVSGHHGTVHVTYKLFGDRVDGTFMAVDTTHAHLNWPATVMWAHGFDDRPSKLTFVLPQELGWKIATQLYPTTDPNTFTSPNLQYLMDSPAELSNYALHTFKVPALKPGGKAQTIRVVAHSQATDAELAEYFAGVEKIVKEEQAVYGELPDYEPGYYTFLTDALPWDNGDGMEHRNSTVMTSRQLGLSVVAHEYFHNWNVERIRPEGLEPFNFRDVNMSGLMFVAEGFTQYYGNLAMIRTGLTPMPRGMMGFARDLGNVINSPATQYRSAMDMSRMAPFVDGASDLFPTYYNNTFVSYYTFGDVVAMGLDLSLRVKTNGKVTLDDFMRAMWFAYGKPGGPAPGLVGHPYSIADVQTQLAKVSGDPAFAADYVKRYMIGTEKVDYAALLQHAGFVMKKKGGATLGNIYLAKKGDPVRRGQAPAGPETLKVAASTIIGSPAYLAGLDLDDELISVGGAAISSSVDVEKAIEGHKPGDSVELVFKRRGQEVRSKAVLAEDPALEIVPVETAGGTLTAEQKAFREAWLGSKAK